MSSPGKSLSLDSNWHFLFFLLKTNRTGSRDRRKSADGDYRLADPQGADGHQAGLRGRCVSHGFRFVGVAVLSRALSRGLSAVPGGGPSARARWTREGTSRRFRDSGWSPPSARERPSFPVLAPRSVFARSFWGRWSLLWNGIRERRRALQMVLRYLTLRRQWFFPSL